MNTQIRMTKVASYRAMSSLETDKPVNLIYGLNGTGKSTISNFLYDGSHQDYQHCKADFDPSAKVLVYNQAFVRDYFYEADGLKGVFGLSKENKEIDRKIASAEEELALLIQKAEKVETRISAEEANAAQHLKQAANATWEIRRQYSGGDRVLEFCLQGLMG